MKKLTVFLIMMLFTGALIAQNTFKYQINANGGIQITGKAKIGADTIATRAYARNEGGGPGTAVDTSHLSNRIDLKAPIANPVFTGIQKISNTDTLATKAYARSVGGGGGDLMAADTAEMLSPYIRAAEVAASYVANADTASMLTPYINRADTADMLAPYALLSEITEAEGISAADTATMLTPYVRFPEVRDIVNDSLSAYLADADIGVSLADSVNYPSGYMSRFDGVTGLAAKVSQIPDSVQHTSSFTLALTDVNKDLYCIKTGNKLMITVPANATTAIPIGTTFNIYCEGSAIVGVVGAANVHLHSDSDSTHSSRIHQVLGLKKRGSNYWILYGPVID